MKKINFIILAISTFLIHSCLKGKDQVLDPEQVNSVVEFASPAALAHAVGDSFRVYTLSYDISPLDTAELIINYAGYNSAPKDLIVNIAVSNQLLTNYNTAKGTSYNVLPSTIYTMPSSVTIKQGTKSAKLIIPIKVDQISLTGTYVLPLQITDASGETISRNFGKSIFIVTAKNKYDGRYNFKTSATTSLQPNISKAAELRTAGPNRVSLYPGLLASYSNEVFYNIDPVTNAVTVECPSLGVQTPQDPRSKYDPVTKVLTVYWKQGNGARTFEETITYLGPR